MKQRYSFEEIDLGDWTDWFAKGIMAVVLGLVVGILFGWWSEKIGILQSCVIWVLIFAAISFREHIRYFIHLVVKLTTGR